MGPKPDVAERESHGRLGDKLRVSKFVCYMINLEIASGSCNWNHD